MTDEQIDLARRLVARPEWRWVEPMRHVWDGIGSGDDRILGPMDEQHTRRDGSILPDLTDDATGGVLLEMLPGPWRAERQRSRDGSPWFAVTWWETGAGFACTVLPSPTLAEAAARALLVCWEGA